MGLGFPQSGLPLMMMCVLSSRLLERLEGKNSWEGFGWQGDNRKATETLGAVSERRSWPHVLYGSNLFVNLLLALANVKVVARTTRSSGSDSEDTTNIWQEVNEAMEATEVMDLRVALSAQLKRPRISTSIVNIVVSSKEDTNSGRLELRRKKRADHVGTSIMMIIASHSTSSQIAAYKSSPIPARGNSPPPSISPLSVPLVELPLGNSGELTLSHKNLNLEKLQDIVGKWQTLMYGIEQRKLYIGMRSEDEVLYKQNEGPARRLRDVQVKNDELASEVAALHVELKEVNEEYKVVVNRINADHEDAMGSLESTIISVGDDTANTLTTNNVNVVEKEERDEVRGEEGEGREDEVPDDQIEI
ncbi:hypothetical protein GOBAR_AA07706 [Gossypium barbadense]|uniref:Uncharacterized protein n=1 Tax=Gossypium barbadense TaxID=3634 RepID=A0A2P5YBF6_GOSBA|nr:hypothetical protein GOBAR_AA07706 [Gossypium barbadense]